MATRADIDAAFAALSTKVDALIAAHSTPSVPETDLDEVVTGINALSAKRDAAETPPSA